MLAGQPYLNNGKTTTSTTQLTSTTKTTTITTTIIIMLQNIKHSIIVQRVPGGKTPGNCGGNGSGSCWVFPGPPIIIPGGPPSNGWVGTRAAGLPVGLNCPER